MLKIGGTDVCALAIVSLAGLLILRHVRLRTALLGVLGVDPLAPPSGARRWAAGILPAAHVGASSPGRRPRPGTSPERGAAAGCRADAGIDRLLAALQLGVLWVEASGTILYANRAAALLLGRPADGLRGRSLSSALGNVCSRAEGPPLSPLQSEAPFIARLVCDRPATGSILGGAVLEVSATPLQDPGEGMLVTVRPARGVSTDGAACESREDLLLLLSHELRSPLAYVSASAELLLDDDLDADLRRQILEEIHDHANRLAWLLDSILDVERLSSGRAEVGSGSVTPYELVSGVLRSSTARHARGRIHVHVGPELPAMRADSVRSGIVLRNLVENALKYAPAGSPITVSAMSEGTQVRIAVRDEGPGIPAERLDALFQRFRRVGDGSQGGGCGHGLGLYISKTLVEAQGGTIGVQSREGEGSTFWFTLPTLAQTGED